MAKNRIKTEANYEEEYLTKDMTRRKRRKQDFKKAIRKENITKNIYHMSRTDEEGWHYYDNLHQYSKNKIHCSCPICSSLDKTKSPTCGAFL